MLSQQIFANNDIMEKLQPWLDLLSLLKCREVNKQWFQFWSESIINALATFEEYAKLYLTTHGMRDETVELMQTYSEAELKRCHTYISGTESISEDEKPFLLNKILKQYIDVRNTIMAASKTDEFVDTLVDLLVKEYDTFVSVLYPGEDLYYGSGDDSFSILLKMAPIETFNQFVFGHDLNNCRYSDRYKLEYIRKSAAKIYLRLVEKESIRIMLNHPKVTKYNNISFDAAGHSNKNLLLLDWDQTLYNGKTPRDGLHEFLKSVSKHFCVWIETGGFNRKKYITELNKIDGINICGVIAQNRTKWRLNKWILENEWFGVNSKFENFLLIDDLWQQTQSKSEFINTIIMPRMGIDESDKSRMQFYSLDVNKVIQFFDFDKNVLSDLAQWLEEWNQYTNIKQYGSTSQFIQKNGLPQLKFTLYDDDKWFFEELLRKAYNPNYKYEHLKKSDE